MLLSPTLHCLSHRRPYYMPYLAWRIPFLSTLNFNANTLRWPPYSTSCFDITLHFLCVCVCVGFLISWRIRKGDLSAPLYPTLHSTCWLLCKNAVRTEHCVAPVLCRFSGRQKTWKGKGRARARARGEWEKSVEENWGVPLKPPLQIRGAERGSKWLFLCGWCDTLKS